MEKLVNLIIVGKRVPFHQLWSSTFLACPSDRYYFFLLFQKFVTLIIFSQGVIFVNLHFRGKGSALTICVLALASMGPIVGFIILILPLWLELIYLLDITTLELFLYKLPHIHLHLLGLRQEH